MANLNEMQENNLKADVQASAEDTKEVKLYEFRFILTDGSIVCVAAPDHYTAARMARGW